MLTFSFADSRLRFAPVAYVLLLLLSSGCTHYRVVLPDGGDGTAAPGTGGNIGVRLPDGQALEVKADYPQTGVDAAVDQKGDLASDGGGDADAGKPTSANGVSCTTGSDCTSGNCVENVCCDTSCSDTCHSCRNALTASSPDGTCAVVASGKDDLRNRCGAAAMPSACGNTGHCDGKGACEKYGSTTVCLPASCAGGSFTAASTCDGKGTCTPGSIQDCKGFTCTATAGCATTCAIDQDCTAGYCSPAKTCAAKKIDGSMCMATNECVHGACVGGICCDSACTGTCLSCSNLETGAANGLCKPISSGGLSKGKCAVDTATCGHDGTCDGTGGCRVASASTPCRTASCTNGTATNPATCDGNGNCPGLSTQVCSPNICSGSACGTGCSSNGGCAAGTACVSGKCSVCGMGLSVCPNACVNLQTDKQNCGACGNACDGYQYCHAGKCTPTYAWTRVLPVVPSDASTFAVRSAAVGSTGDIFLEVELDAGATPATITFSNATEVGTQVSTMFGTLVLGRYASNNVLKSGGDLANLFTGYPSGITIFSTSGFALTSNDDLMLAGVDVLQPPPGPGTPPPNPWLLSRFLGPGLLARKWTATYPVVGSATPPAVRTIFPRAPRGDYVTLGNPGTGGGQIVQVLESASAVTVLGGYFASTAALGSDQTTLWFGGLGSGSPAALNPWSPTTTTVSAGAAYLIGAKDNGTSFGPWTTTSTMPGQAGSFLSLVPTPANDLVINAGGGGLGSVISLNGHAIVGSQDVLSIFKFATSTGTVVWKNGIPNGPLPFIAVAPDGSTVAVTPQTATNYGFVTYADADGSIPASFVGQGGADAIAVGGNSLYVLGRVRATTNFNPGTKTTDIQGNLPGIFITRFAY